MIIRNVLDSGKYGKHDANEMGNVYIAFESNQIKDVNNQNPTGHKDIRYKTPVGENAVDKTRMIDQNDGSQDVNPNGPNGGVISGEESQESEIIYRGREEIAYGMEGKARAEAGDRSGVPGYMGETESSVRKVRTGLENESKYFSEADFAEAPNDSALLGIQKEFEELGIECHVVKTSSWTRKNPAHCRAGKVYVAEHIDPGTLATVVPHETTHVMKQRNYAPYLDFIAKTPDLMNLKKRFRAKNAYARSRTSFSRYFCHGGHTTNRLVR